jgi:hypothetical protein
MPSRYQTIPTTKNDTGVPSTSGKVMYVPIYYPNIEAQADDNYILTGVTDRLDNIAFDFYGDATLWWVIAMVNDLAGDSVYPPTAVYLRIPKDLSSILSKYNKFNNI